MKVHRRDVFGSMRTIGIRVVIVWDMTVKDCIARIRTRGLGHRSIKPGDNAAMIVGRTNKELEPISDEEISLYQIHKIIRISDPTSMTKEAVVRQILDGIKEFLATCGEITDEDIAKAVKRTMKREESICSENSQPAQQSRQPASRQAIKGTPTVRVDRYTGPIIREGRYEISVNEKEVFKRLFTLFQDTKGFELKSEFHVTLLFIKRALARYIEGESKGDGSSLFSHSPDEYAAAVSRYDANDVHPVPLKILYVARNDRVMAARVEILDTSVPFFDVVPHVSIAKVEDAQFRESNELIASVEQLRGSGISLALDGVEIVEVPPADSVCNGTIVFKTHGS